jgi:hypothetical protein
MTDTEVTFDPPTKPAKKRTKKPRNPPRRASFQKPAAPFPGLTRSLCATACSATACSVSGKSYCAHPTKGGLQPGDMADTAAKKRLQDARDQIDVRLDPDRFR